MPSLIQLRVIAAVARLGSVTEAARELHYSQPSVSHHLARLEASVGVRLLQRVGRGIRLTPEGELLATRAAEIVGRVESATRELDAQAALHRGRVRLAANSSVLSTLVPAAVTEITSVHPGITVTVREQHPTEALQLLRRSEIDVALVFGYPDAALNDADLRLTHLRDDTIHLVSRRPNDTVANHRESTWIGGCVWCREELAALCRREGFRPTLGSASDDMVVVQALVAAGVGVSILSGLALRAHRNPAVHTTEVTSAPRRIYAAVYGDPPDPPAVAALIEVLARVSARD